MDCWIKFKYLILAGHAISKQRDDLFLTADVENEINYSVPIEQRLKTLKLLSEIVLNNKLEEVSFINIFILFLCAVFIKIFFH